MELINHKIIINIKNNNYQDWKSCLRNELKEANSKIIEINCENLCLSCKDILSIIEIANKFNCSIIRFLSSSLETIISSKALGYQSQLVDNQFFKKSASCDIASSSETIQFHKGTVRSGEYLESQGDLLIFGDVNPGAIVCAEGNVIIWGKLLGIAHAGSKGNSKAKIAALHLRPLQLRIADQVARGPNEKPKLGFAEQATIESDKITISVLDNL